MAMPKDATELFETRIPVALEKFPDQAKDVNAIYCFKISGKGGGTWTVDMTQDPPTCKAEESETAQCTIEVGHNDFKAMLSDPEKGMQLYFQQKLKVSGDPVLATKLQQFFDLAAKAG